MTEPRLIQEPRLWEFDHGCGPFRVGFMWKAKPKFCPFCGQSIKGGCKQDFHSCAEMDCPTHSLQRIKAEQVFHTCRNPLACSCAEKAQRKQAVPGSRTCAQVGHEPCGMAHLEGA